MIKLSKRLTAAAALVNPCRVLADIGTDHGYVPIYLVEQGKIHRAIAMDINRGPLQRAQEHIAQYNMEGRIETRLSDGVAALAPGEAQTILIAGMGGGLAIHILLTGRAVCQKAGELILQPQSELFQVRKFLAEEGYVIREEDMVEEDGKFYPMMRISYGPDAVRNEETPTFLTYGRKLLEQRHPVLRTYLEKERRVFGQIESELRGQRQTEAIGLRKKEIEEAKRRNEEALSFYGHR